MYNCMRPKCRTFFMFTRNVLCVRVFSGVIVNGHREKCSVDLPLFFSLEGSCFKRVTIHRTSDEKI